jgi:metallophosphoesterase (TIGR00282 family)
MRILYIGDVMGEAGLQVVEYVLPKIRQEKQIDLVIAQAENVSNGKGIRVGDFRRLQKAGIDFCTGGNWSMYRDEIWPLLTNPNEPIIRPANYPHGTAGLGYKYIGTPGGKVLVVSLLGHIVGKDADKLLDNPLQIIDRILDSQKETANAGLVVNFHGDYSSEKVVIGHYLDGQATLVVGDHWHVPTADARVLPNGTAHITDVGMCGALDSSLGVSFKSVIPRWRDGQQTRNILENEGPKQFNGVLVDTNSDGLANSIEQIQHII